jgi:invasion protein IalB
MKALARFALDSRAPASLARGAAAARGGPSHAAARFGRHRAEDFARAPPDAAATSPEGIHLTILRERLSPAIASLLAAAACAALLAGPASAQNKPAAKPEATSSAAAKDLPKAPAPEWIKMCGKDAKAGTEICGTENFLLAAAGNVVGQIRVLDIKNGKESKRVFAAQIPEGFLIQPGVNLVVDNEKKPLQGKYTVCFPNGCVAEVPLSDDALNKLKKGDTLTLFAANPAGKWVGAKASLAGFTKAYEGPPTDPKDYQAKRKAFDDAQNALKQALLKRAEDQRQKFEAQQNAKAGKPAASAPAPATPAPAPKK